MHGVKFLFWAGGLASFYLSAQSLELKQALDLAVQNSPEYLQARERKEITRLQKESGRAAFLPTLTAGAQFGLKDNLISSASTKPEQSSFSLLAREKLYDNGQSISQYRIVSWRDEAESLSFLQAREDLSLKILHGYIRLSRARLVNELRNLSHERLLGQYRFVKSQYEQGLKIRRDFLRFEAQVNRSDISRQESLQEAQLAELDLRQLISGELPPTQRFSSLIIDEKKSMAGQLTLELDKTLSYRVNELRQKISAENVQLKKREYWPEVFLTGELSYGSSQFWRTGRNLRDNDALEASVMLNLQYTLWDWGIKRRQVAQARAQERIENQVYRAENTATRTMIEKLSLELPQNQAKLRVSMQLKGLEDKNFRFLEQEYREGRGVSYVDLSQARENYLDATEDFYRSYFECLENLGLSYQLGGKLYDEIQTSAVF